MGRKNKMPAKVKAFWCWGCLSFVVIDWKAGKYFCAKLCEDINPRDHMNCRQRNIVPFTEDEDDGEQLELDMEGAE